MKLQQNKIRRIMAFVCIGIVMLFVLFAFTLHTHSCYDSDCMVCAAASLHRGVICTLVLLGTIQLGVIKCIEVFAVIDSLPTTSGALVKWKVKLSN